MKPTGSLRRTATGVDLELTRTFDAPRDDVWASLTESDRTARWYGPWEWLAEGVVRVQLAYEEGTSWSEMRIDVCEPPARLAVAMTPGEGSWQLEARLDEVDGVTTLTFVHHLNDTEGVGDIGPGWEYYLDMLVASRDEQPLPSFDDYYPDQQSYYESLAAR